VKAARKALGREVTVSSELVPFQEIDVYAKEAGYVQKLLVDYGTRVQAGQLMAVLEIPELEAQLREDEEQVRHSQHELSRAEAQHTVVHLQFQRLDGVGSARPGLVAQQEIDDARGRDLAAEAAVQGAEAQMSAARAKREHDQVLFDYSRITAPFAGVVTQRFANLGTLLQAGTNSSTQALPLARLSQDDLFRLVIPVPESCVRYIHVGDPVSVKVGSLGRTFPGKVARFSVDVNADTRTMHTEVDVPNPGHALMPGLYAEATLTLENREAALAIPLQALNRQADKVTVDVVDKDSRIVEQPVTLGVQTADEVEVAGGLSEGALVVVSDRGGLKKGQQVTAQPIEEVKLPAGENP
jgi:RND family efflux transporter MFP subunit